MAEEEKTFPGIAPKDDPANGAGENLSAEIARTIPREPREQVTCRRVAPNHYRCNWWAQDTTGQFDNPSMAGLLVTTSKICKSRFLRVTKTAEGLQITGN